MAVYDFGGALATPTCRPEGYPDFLPVGRATVVPLGASYANGGRAAERVILERLLRALSPLLKEGAAPVQVGLAALHGDPASLLSGVEGVAEGVAGRESCACRLR